MPGYKAGDAILALLDADRPATHLLLGSNATGAVATALGESGQEVERSAPLTSKHGTTPG